MSAPRDAQNAVAGAHALAQSGNIDLGRSPVGSLPPSATSNVSHYTNNGTSSHTSNYIGSDTTPSSVHHIDNAISTLSTSDPIADSIIPQSPRTTDSTSCGDFEVHTNSTVVYDNDDLECRISICLKKGYLLKGMKVSLISRIVYRRHQLSSLVQETSSTTKPIDISTLSVGEQHNLTVNFLVPMFSPPTFRTRHDVYLGEDLIHLDAEVQWLVVLMGVYPDKTRNDISIDDNTASTSMSVLALKQITKRTLYEPESQYTNVEGTTYPMVMSAIAPNFRKTVLSNTVDGFGDGNLTDESKDSFGSAYGVGPSTGTASSRTAHLSSHVGPRTAGDEEAPMEIINDGSEDISHTNHTRSGNNTSRSNMRSSTGVRATGGGGLHNSTSPARSPSTHKPEMTFMYNSNRPPHNVVDSAYADMEPASMVTHKPSSNKYQVVMRAKCPGMISTDEVFSVKVKIKDVTKLLYVRRVKVQLNQNVTYMYGDQRRQWLTVIASGKAKPKTGSKSKSVTTCEIKLDAAQKKYRRDFLDFAAESYMESFPVPTCIVTNKQNKILLSVEYTLTIKCYVRGGKDIRRMVPVVMESRTSLPDTVGDSSMYKHNNHTKDAHAELEHLIPAPEAHSLPTFDELSLANDSEDNDSADSGDDLDELDAKHTNGHTHAHAQGNLQGDILKDSSSHDHSKTSPVNRSKRQHASSFVGKGKPSVGTGSHQRTISESGGIRDGSGMGTSTQTQSHNHTRHIKDHTQPLRQHQSEGGSDSLSGPIRVSLPASASRGMAPPTYEKVQSRSTATNLDTAVDFGEFGFDGIEEASTATETGLTHTQNMHTSEENDANATKHEARSAPRYSNLSVETSTQSGVGTGAKMGDTLESNANLKVDKESSSSRSRSGSGTESILRSISKRAQRLTTPRSARARSPSTSENERAMSCTSDVESMADLGPVLEMQRFTSLGDMTQLVDNTSGTQRERTRSDGVIGLPMGTEAEKAIDIVKTKEEGIGSSAKTGKSKKRDSKGKHSRTRSLNALQQIIKKTVSSDKGDEDESTISESQLVASYTIVPSPKHATQRAPSQTPQDTTSPPAYTPSANSHSTAKTQGKPPIVPTHVMSVTTESGISFAKFAEGTTEVSVPHSQGNGTAVFIPEGASYEAVVVALRHQMYGSLY